jgi:hypothetical protein
MIRDKFSIQTVYCRRTTNAHAVLVTDKLPSYWLSRFSGHLLRFFHSVFLCVCQHGVVKWSCYGTFVDLWAGARNMESNSSFTKIQTWDRWCMEDEVFSTQWAIKEKEIHWWRFFVPHSIRRIRVLSRVLAQMAFTNLTCLRTQQCGHL